MQTTRKRKRFSIGQAVIVIFMLLMILICVMPFLNVIAISFSSKTAIQSGKVTFWPVGFNTQAYEAIFNDASMFQSLYFTIKITVLHTALAMLLTILLAYPLTVRRMRWRKSLMFFTVFTMYFSGGTIPIYLNIKELGLLDTQWSLILPTAISTFNVIILKNFFAQLPYDMNEAAYIDGATDFQVLTRIYLPLSLSSIATLSLFYAVAKWNSFSDALYYITSRNLQPLQLKLYNIIKGNQNIEISILEGNANDISSNITESIESATILFATLPILLVYPFVQRFFVAGVTMGAVKG